MNGWFDVNKDGLKQLMEGRPKCFVVRELIQNAWDEPNVTRCDVTIERVSKGLAEIVVEDDAPEGFVNLADAFTLFGHTRKRVDPEARGRFNFGEKQCLALCRYASITTTKGTVSFNRDGTRATTRQKVERGSRVKLVLPMTMTEVADADAAVMNYFPPKHVKTTINGRPVRNRRPHKTTVATLQTEFENAHGFWRRTRRKTEIQIITRDGGEQPMLYEMGLPVVPLEAGDPWHINIMQRVPLNSDRDNVPPAFLTEVRAHVLNVMADTVHLMNKDAAAARWTREAAGSPIVTKQAFITLMNERYGKARVAYCPSDSESNRTAASHGYTVLTGGSLTKEEWENAKRYEAIPSAGEKFKTARPKFGGDNDTRVPENEWWPELKCTVEMMRALGGKVLEWNHDIQVEVVRDRTNRFRAWYAKGGFLTLNLACLSKADIADKHAMLSLFIHEIGHERCDDHLLDDYHRALCDYGARLALLAASEPSLLGD